MTAERYLLLGNEAIARGLLENGCQMATSYPGTPASEILASLSALKLEFQLPAHVQWAVNEKIAFEIAYTGAIVGLRTAVSMKQVGLNVAADPLMSAAYMGVKGGFIVISADDPGPHSSQTEQDSRLMAMLAKIPALDPDSPLQAKELIRTAFLLSETFEIPVMLRPTTRVCHARQDVAVGVFPDLTARPVFEKHPERWAATPKFRLQLHHELERKLEQIAAFPQTAPVLLNPALSGQKSGKVLVASGVAAAHAKEILAESGYLSRLPVYQVLQPFPLHAAFIAHLRTNYEEILVLEETSGVIEMQLADQGKTQGKMTKAIPRVGELLPELIEDIIQRFMGKSSRATKPPAIKGKRPTLCAGCPHRAAFFAIKRAMPKGVYAGDIGCYTLGLNLKAVDTVLCMGASISQAAGFYHAFRHAEKPPQIAAAIGDSTFFHAGIPALIDAVVQQARFVLVILDNGSTAMTGNQPTPASGQDACGQPTPMVSIEAIAQGCGVGFCRVGDPYRLPEFIALLKEACQFSQQHGPAVVIARGPCLLNKSARAKIVHPIQIQVTEKCDGCGYCAEHFECPAIIAQPDKPVLIDRQLCSGCGVCIHVCPKHALTAETHWEAD